MNDNKISIQIFCELYRELFIEFLNRGCELLKDNPNQCRQFIAQMESEMKITIKELTRIMVGKN